MAHNDKEFELSEAPTTATNLLSLAAGSMTSTKVTKHTRYRLSKTTLETLKEDLVDMDY